MLTHIIIDQTLKQELESIHLRPNRSFYCGRCLIVVGRSRVYKDAEGLYHCNGCNRVVVDVTEKDK